MTNFFSIIVLTGGPPRPVLTAKCIESINKQSFTNIQKILVNNGRPQIELMQISKFREKTSSDEDLLVGWEVVTLDNSAYNPDDYTSVWRLPGLSGLKIVEGKYLFCINDDDFLDKKFFEEIHASLIKYPDAITAFGFPMNYAIESGEAFPPLPGSWETRPEYEDGIIVTQNYFKFDPSYHPNPGFSFICLTEKVRPIAEYFFSGGFPDFTALIQIVPFGKTIFNRNAYMFLGMHEEQQRNTWTSENEKYLTYNKAFKDMLRINLAALDFLNVIDIKLINLVRYHFSNHLVEISFAIIWKYFWSLLVKFKQTEDLHIVFSHSQNLLKHPMISLSLAFRYSIQIALVLKNKICIR